jgi:hypothetical protein
MFARLSSPLVLSAVALLLLAAGIGLAQQSPVTLQQATPDCCAAGQACCLEGQPCCPTTAKEACCPDGCPDCPDCPCCPCGSCGAKLASRGTAAAGGAHCCSSSK